MEQRKQLLELFILKDELEYFHKSLCNENGFSSKLRLIKHNIIALNTFLDTLDKFNSHIKNNQQLKHKTKSIRKRGELIKHMRNKIGGHLDDDVLIRGAQWTPFIYSKEVKLNNEMQTYFAYKTILEASINSHIDVSSNDERQKDFGREIDFFYPPDAKMFFNYMGGLNTDSIEWIQDTIELIEKDFKYFNKDELLDKAKESASTDFNLKKDHKLPNIGNNKKNDLIVLAEQIYYEEDKTKKFILIKRLLSLLNKKISP